MHNHEAASKIKYKHSIIQHLRHVLEEIEVWEEIKTIIPGRINRTKARSMFKIAVQYQTSSGLKCIAKSGGTVQEVFFVTVKPQELKERIEKRWAE